MADLWVRVTSKGDLYVEVVDKPSVIQGIDWPEGVELVYRPGHPGADPALTAQYSSREKAHAVLARRGFKIVPSVRDWRTRFRLVEVPDDEGEYTP